MDLISNKNYFFPRRKNQLLALPLQNIPCSIHKYTIDKYFIVNSNYIYRTEDYFCLSFKDNSPPQTISNDYMLKINNKFEMNGDYFALQRKKINILVFINKTEPKIKDLYALLFYLFNQCPSKPIQYEDLISVTIIMCSYTYMSEFKPNCIFHDKPYHFYTDYCTNNKNEYEKFTKNKIPKFQVLNLNMYEVGNLDIMISLDVKPLYLPHFIIYDQNFKVLYKDNLFQETPQSFVKICDQLYTLLKQPYNPFSKIYLDDKCKITISTVFEKIEKEIQRGAVFNSKDEFITNKKTILDKCIKMGKHQNKGRTCKLYFITKVSNLNYDLTENANESVITYLKPFVFQNSGNPLPDFFFGSEFVKIPKLFHKGQTEDLHYTYKCVLCYMTNTNIKCNLSFVTKKRISNLYLNEQREFNVEYLESFDNYFTPLNFKILFRDKTKYFSVNFFPRLNPSETYCINCKDISDKDKAFIIKENEITIIQYFREDLYVYQTDLSEIISTFQNKYKQCTFKYCIIILIPCDKLKNSIHYEGILSFINKCKHLNDVMYFTYVSNEFKELTKYLTNNPFIYVFDRNKRSTQFEVFPGDKKKIEENLNNILTYMLNEKRWKFDINKHQYKLCKQINDKILAINKYHDDKEVITLHLNKVKYFDNRDTTYSVEIENKIEGDIDENTYNQINVIKKEIGDIIGNDADKISFNYKDS